MMPVVGADLSKRRVPDELWKLAAPLLPSFAARPQGGGTAPCDDRAVFTAVVYVLTSGCAWRHLPPAFGTSHATAHRRFTVWTEAGLWRRLHRAALDELGAGARWTGPQRSSTRPPFAPKGGSLTGPNPVDRGKKGSKLHVLPDAQGIPLAVAVSGADMHDSLALKPLIRGIPAVRSRRGPRRRRPVKLRADKAYFSAAHWPGCAGAGSSHASRGPASSPANASVGTAGRSSGRSPGSSATAASPSDTNGRARTSSPSSAWPPPRSATRSSRSLPRETTFLACAAQPVDRIRGEGGGQRVGKDANARSHWSAA
ncbi:IS5 family transposase [Streptomyces sp. NPDC015220]|uniref:IS5 family transposase n=1 Tax=Streptomyces sp. NPDC015220 TaxID=3364947 RepID=UPI003700E3BB